MNGIEITVRALWMLMHDIGYEHIDHGNGTHTVIIVPTQSQRISKP